MTLLLLKIRSWSGALVTLPLLESDAKLEELKAAVLSELKDTPPPGFKVLLRRNGLPLLGDSFTLEDHGLKDGDILTFELVPPKKVEKTVYPPTNVRDDVTFIREQLLTCPEDIVLLQKTNPRLAKALIRGEYDEFSKIVTDILKEHDKVKDAKLEKLVGQKKKSKVKRQFDRIPKVIPAASPAPEIQSPQVLDVNGNFVEVAKEKELDPASLKKFCDAGGPRTLFVNAKVNEYPVKAHVDPGSSVTTMSKSCASRTRVLNLLDLSASNVVKTYAGIMAASTNPGLKSLGKIRNFNIEVANKFLISTFSIVETQKWDIVLGLDFLKFHGCVIDIGRNALTMPLGCEVPFLQEQEQKSEKSPANRQDCKMLPTKLGKQDLTA